MKKLKTYDEFVNEGIMDVIKTPIKYVKIKNNLKKYQKAKVKQALNDVDFAKRKAKGRDEMTDKQKEVLTQANKAKNAALADTTATRAPDLVCNRDGRARGVPTQLSPCDCPGGEGHVAQASRLQVPGRRGACSC